MCAECALIAAAFVVCVVICFIAFRKGHMRLKDVPLAVFASVFFPQLAIVYITLTAGLESENATTRSATMTAATTHNNG